MNLRRINNFSPYLVMHYSRDAYHHPLAQVYIEKISRLVTLSCAPLEEELSFFCLKFHFLYGIGEVFTSTGVVN